jgi:S-DNA-T family DNA segregation ATPase FtsK/SpoIIIE
VNFSPTDSQNIIKQNYLGSFGSIIAGYSYWMLGLSGWIIPFTLIWFGVCIITGFINIVSKNWIGLILLLATTSTWFEINQILTDSSIFMPFGASGAIGTKLGNSSIHGLLGTKWLSACLILLYISGFFWVSGFHPWRTLCQVKDQMIAQFKYKKLLRIQKLEAKIRHQQLQASQSWLSSPSFNQDSLPPITPELPLEAPAPAPKISVNFAPPPPSNSYKPKLAEVWERNRAETLSQTPNWQLSALAVKFKNYKLPNIELLTPPPPSASVPPDMAPYLETQQIIVRTLSSFGVKVSPSDITCGPSITRYEILPDDGFRVNRISALTSDLARATRAERINIIAPIPGKDTVGIEIANAKRTPVLLRELLEDDNFTLGNLRLPVALGKDVYGKCIIADLAAMPHLLVAGSTGSGKSVCVNGIISSLLCRFAPDELRFVMIDPKVVEMQNYARLPHLALPVITDPKKALMALRWVVNEMESRYKMFATVACRNFESFNNRPKKGQPIKVRVKKVEQVRPMHQNDNPWEDEPPPPPSRKNDTYGDLTPPATQEEDEVEIPDRLPYMVVIIDELADLMQTAPADIEVSIARITQMARAAGIHLIIATQTPRADVITGVIKANVPTRIAFQVASALDSRVILDRKGAENLVGKGDMLYVPPGGANTIRAQGALVTDEEIHLIVDSCAAQGQPIFEESSERLINSDTDETELDPEDAETLERCIEVIRQEKKASTSLFQRRLRLGYGKAARMIDLLEQRKIIGPGDGARPREILVDLEFL